MSTGNAFNSNTLVPRIVNSDEKVTGPAAAEMLRRCGIGSDGSKDIQVLDNATGGGILVAELFKHLQQGHGSSAVSRVVAGDIDEAMLGFMRQNQKEGLQNEPAWNRVEITKVDQQLIPLPDDTFSYVFSNMGIFFCKDDAAALKASYATPALSAHLPEAPPIPAPGGMFPSQGWTNPQAIPAKMEAVGFRDVQVSEHSFTPDIEPEAFAEATAALVKIVASRVWSPEDNAKYAQRVEPSMLKYAMENFPQGRWDGKMTAIVTIVKKP